MGYSVYWANDRWQGYDIPAYCDVKGCENKIDRGMGYQHEEDNEGSTPNVFCCNDHIDEPLVNLELDEGLREHPDWLKHILNHDSWEQWRNENTEYVKDYQNLLNKDK